MDTFNWLGVTMMSVAAIVVLGLLILLLFLAVARHRMLGLAVLAFVLLFVGMPLFWTVSRRAAEYHGAPRRQADVRMQHDRAQWPYEGHQEPWRPHQPAKPSRPVKPAKPKVPHPTTKIHEMRAQTASMVAELTPAERLTYDGPHTMARHGSGGVLAEVDASADMKLLQTAEEPAGTGELLAAVELPATAADAAELAATPSPSAAEAPAAELAAEATADAAPQPAAEPPAVVQRPAVQRPDWVETHPDRVDGQPAVVLVSDPFETGDECDQDIQRRVIAAIQRFGDRQGQRIGAPRGLNLPVHSADLHLVSRQRFVDVIPTSVGPMKQAYRLIVFDEEFCRVLDRRISEAVVGQRLVRTGVFSGGVLLLVGSLFGILKGASRRQAKAASA